MRLAVAGELQRCTKNFLKLANTMGAGYKVPLLEVRVLATRPKDHAGEFHGLYQPEENIASLISIRMRTAELKKAVAFKTFLRTLIHELCHHLDYEMCR